MNFELFTRVALLKDLPEYNLKKGDVATIVDSHPGLNDSETGYSLEVFNAIGETIAVICLDESEIEPLQRNEIFAVRHFETVAA